jgi:SPP1 family predicted phage head-tail adaptor
MIETGLLQERVRFDKREVRVDDYGNERGEFVPQFTCWGRKRMLVGGETVLANRLAGRSPAVITVRSATWTRQVTTDWACRDQHTGEVYAIRAVTPSEDRAHIDFLVEGGVALG